MNNKEFIEETKKIGINLTNDQLNQLEQYFIILEKENKITNLTRIIEKEDVYLKHFYDSLTIFKIIDLNETETLCDIGSGAGFPGIVLKIAFPNLKITLIDSTNKKVEFLKKVIKELKLENVNAICERVENHKKMYDVVTARAVAKLNILIELCTPITKINGHFIAMKANIDDELYNSGNALKTMNCEVIETSEFNLPNEKSNRFLVKILKKEKTNEKYPREFDKIIKNPL